MQQPFVHLTLKIEGGSIMITCKIKNKKLHYSNPLTHLVITY